MQFSGLDALSSFPFCSNFILGFTVHFSLELFEWSSNNSCADYISVRGEESYSGQYPRVCGENGWEHTYNTTSSRVWVHYHSDWPHEGAFLMDYSTTGDSDDYVLTCGGPLNGKYILDIILKYN